MEKLFQAVYGALLYGSVYGLMALGMSLVYGSLRLLNLAHGALYMVGGYIAWMLISLLHLPVLPSLFLAAGGTAAMGWLLHMTLVNPMLGKPGWDNASWIAMVGAGMVLESLALLIYGPQVKQLPPLLPGSFSLGGVLIAHQGLTVIVISMVCLYLLSLFLRTSRHGLAIRAVSQDMDAARLMGAPVRTVFLIVMCVSAAMAGLAGSLLGSVLYVSPTAGFLPMLKALVVTIFGGLGSMKGTVWAAYIIGVLESFVQVYLGAGWALPGLFLFIIIVLTIRPSGLFGLGEVRRL